MNRFKKLTENRLNRGILLVFVMMLLLNILAVPTSDDLGYAINNGLLDIFHREYVQYMTWTGRSVAHMIDRVFLAMPKGVFNVFNSGCFCFLIWLINVHASGSTSVSAEYYLLTALLIFLFGPLFGQTVLWETGSCNYLWTTTIIFSFLLAYRFYLQNQKVHSKKFTILFTIAGIAAGWTNENTGGALIMMVMIYCLLYKIKKIPLKPWMFTGLAGVIAGFAMMVLAPGNSIRAAEFVNTGGKAYTLVHDLVNTIAVFKEGMIVLMILLAAGIALLIQEKKMYTLILAVSYALCGAAAVCAIMLTPVPVYYDRSMFGAAIFVITGIMSAFANETVVNRWNGVMIAVLSVFAVLNYSYAVVDLGYTRYQFMNREEYVNRQKESGNLNPVVPAIYTEFVKEYNPLYGLNDILDYPSFVNNVSFAEAHGLQSVTSTTLERWNLIYRFGDPYLMNIGDFETYMKAGMEDPDKILLITCSGVDETVRELLSRSGVELKDSTTNFTMMTEAGNHALNEADEPVGNEYSVNGHYCYISSQNEGSISDIVVDTIEYTNDREGLSVVAYSISEDRVVDSVTFTAEGATRSYIEK